MNGARLWHLCWRAAEGRDFLGDASLATRIRQQIIVAHQRPGRTLISFLVAREEIHVVSRLPRDEGPGTLAQPFSCVVSRWFRQRHPAPRAVFASRVTAHPLQGEEELRAQVRMIGWRPVIGSAYRCPAEAPHTALRVALGAAPPRGYDCRPLLALYGEDVAEARDALRRALRGRPSTADMVRWLLVSRLAVLERGPGERQVKAAGVRSDAAALLVAAGGDGLPGALRLLAAWVGSQLDVYLDPEFGAPAGECSPLVRALVGCLAVRHQLCSASAVARHVGRSRATLCEQMLVVRRSPLARRMMSTPIRHLVDSLQGAPPVGADGKPSTLPRLGIAADTTER